MPRPYETVEDRDIETIVSCESLLGPEPEIAVAGLGYRIHRVLRQTGPIGQARLDILRHILMCVEPGAGRSQQPKHH
jgi:hypothetical protein